MFERQPGMVCNKYLLVNDPSGNIKLEAIDDYRIRKTIRREKAKVVGVA